MIAHVRLGAACSKRLGPQAGPRVHLIARVGVHGVETDGGERRGRLGREDVREPARSGAERQARCRAQRIVLVDAGVVGSRLGVIEDSHLVGAAKRDIVVGDIEVAAAAPRSAPTVLDEEGARARGGLREVRGGIVVVPADYDDRVVRLQSAVVVVARGRGFVVRGARVNPKSHVHAAVEHDSILDVGVVKSRGAGRDPVDLLHVVARGQPSRSVAIAVGIVALVHRAAPPHQVRGGHIGVPAHVVARRRCAVGRSEAALLSQVVLGEVERTARQQQE